MNHKGKKRISLKKQLTFSMCGISGYWGEGNNLILARMGRSLAHRGPDAEDQYIHGPVGLAHRRLSIIDLSPTGSQPMSSRDGSVTIVFNGEIYNYKELKDEFLSGYLFNGSSDTEVLLHLYEKFGDPFLEKIKGMFALAIYDQNKGKLLLARDHLGKKPLYWTKIGTTLIFGSELKALRAHPKCPSDIMRTSVAQYLIYEYIPAPATIYQDVYKLLPGGYLNYDGEEIVHGTFSDIQPHQGVYIKEFGEAKDQLSNLLHTAVARRMVADVPVGVFLSGGLDSSTITYFAQELTKHQVKTFSIGFKDASFDESAYAREVARVLGTDHHERIVGSEDLLRIIDTLPQVLDEPMADSSIIPTLLLSEFTREEVSVVLGGDGADEIFWGYDTFLAHRVGEWYERVPRIIQKSIRVLAETLPVSHKYMSFDFKAKRFLSGFETVNIRRNAYWLSAFIPNELVSILNFDVSIDEIFAPSDKYYGANIDFKDSLQEEYIKGYLAEDILVKTDRAGMAFGLEVRAPFLDIDLVDFAVTLDSHYKYRGHTGKFILKEIMKGHLPNHVIERKKKGFNIPIGSWIRSDLKDLFTEKLLNGKLVESGLFKREGLAILLESHLSGQFDHRKKLWALLVLALWMEKWHE